MWQIAVPAVAGFVGATLSVVVQILISRSQQRHAKEQWLNADRRKVYADFILKVSDQHAILLSWREADGLLIQLKKHAANMLTITQERLDAINKALSEVTVARQKSQAVLNALERYDEEASLDSLDEDVRQLVEEGLAIQPEVERMRRDAEAYLREGADLRRSALQLVKFRQDLLERRRLAVDEFRALRRSEGWLHEFSLIAGLKVKAIGYQLIDALEEGDPEKFASLRKGFYEAAAQELQD